MSDALRKHYPVYPMPPATPATVTDPAEKQEAITRATTAVKTTVSLDFVREVRGRS